MSNKNKSPKNDNKTIISAFLGENKNINLPYEECMNKFFASEENKKIRKDAFRFYFKRVKDGKVEINPAKKITPEKVIKAEVKKPAIKPPTKAAVKKAIAKTKVVTAAKI